MEAILVILAVVCIPWMLFVKPFVLRSQNKKRSMLNVMVAAALLSLSFLILFLEFHEIYLIIFIDCSSIQYIFVSQHLFIYDSLFKFSACILTRRLVDEFN